VESYRDVPFLMPFFLTEIFDTIFHANISMAKILLPDTAILRVYYSFGRYIKNVQTVSRLYLQTNPDSSYIVSSDDTASFIDI